MSYGWLYTAWSVMSKSTNTDINLAKGVVTKGRISFDAALKGSHHQSGETVMEEFKVRGRRSGKPSPS